MPSWGEILREVTESAKKTGRPALDATRRKYLAELNRHTQRNTIVYASNWISPVAGSNADAYSITDEDLQGFMEAIYGLKGGGLDLILHSPGGSAESVEAIVLYLREKFTDIRVIIPQAAMSAATMLACAANLLVMGKQS